MSILCGHCGQNHESVAAVKECSLRNPSHPYLSDLQEFNNDLPIDNFIPTQTRFPAAVPMEPGFYKTEEDIFKVVNSQKGFPYAMKMDHESGKFEYAPGEVKKLDSTMRMTREDAAQYGKLTGRCMVCGRELTNPESIERGIGPICAENF